MAAIWSLSTRCIALAALFGFAVSSAAAQENAAAPALTPEPARAPAPVEVTLPSGTVPESLLGNRCSAEMPTGPTIQLFRLCMSRDLMRQPSAVFAVETASATLSLADMRNYMAEPFHERQIFQERLRSFTVPSRPAAVGLFGIFQLDLGNRYVWVLQDGDRITRVMVFALAEINLDQVSRSIETNIYGRVTYGAMYRGGANQ